MWERFSYYGMRALLVLYLVNQLNWSDGRAASLYGTYTSLVYLTPLLGGYLADRLLGTRRSLVIGGIVIALGHFTLALQTTQTFYIGLALVIIGTGFFKSNVSTMVGQIYGAGDSRRDSGFTVYYMGINTGAFIAPLICGYLGQKVGWHWGFGAAGVGMVLGLIVYLSLRDKYLPGIGLPPSGRPAAAAERTGRGNEESTPAEHRAALLHALLGAAIGAALGWNGGAMGIAMGSVITAALFVSLLGTHGEERMRVIAIFIVVFFAIFFWMAFEQAGSSMNLFADRHVDLNVLGFSIPSSWFQSVEAACILIFAIPFAWLWRRLNARGREPATAMKMVYGLFLLGLGFVFLVVGGRGADAGLKVSPLWLIAAYMLHAWGELSVSPVGLSYITKVAPYRFASLLMGVWFLANAAANKLGGFLEAQTESIPSQSTFFTIPVVTSWGAAVLMLLLVPVLKRLTATVKA